MVLKYANKSKFTFSGYLTSWPWTYEGFHIIPINQVWFKSDYNFSNEAIFTFSAYLTAWPQMTFDLGKWPLTAWTYEGSHIVSINRVWFKSDFNFSNEAIFTFSAYLTTWPCYIYDPTLVEIHQSMWKIEPNVNPFHNRQLYGTKWSLCVFPAKAGNTKKTIIPDRKRHICSPFTYFHSILGVDQELFFLNIPFQLVHSCSCGKHLVCIISGSCRQNKIQQEYDITTL